MAEEQTVNVSTKIPLLNGSNYYSWKFKAEMVLKDKGLWGHVTGNAQLRQNAGAAEREKFAKECDKALATICLHIDDGQQMFVQGAVNARDAWDRLSRQYERRTLSNKLFLRRKFLNLKMEEDEDMTKHITSLRALATQLANIGAPVSDDDMVTTMLCSLPESYDSLITALESRDPADLTMQFVVGRLMHEADKRSEKNGNGDLQVIGEEKAMYSQRGGKKGKGSSGKNKPYRPGVCNECKKPGHWARECPDRESSEMDGQKTGQSTNGSKEHSHMARRTPEDDGPEEESYEAFVSSVDPVERNNVWQWIIDSAATRHMTSHGEWMWDYRELEAPTPVVLGPRGWFSVVGSWHRDSKDAKWWNGQVARCPSCPKDGKEFVFGESSCQKGCQDIFYG